MPEEAASEEKLWSTCLRRNSCPTHQTCHVQKVQLLRDLTSDRFRIEVHRGQFCERYLTNRLLFEGVLCSGSIFDWFGLFVSWGGLALFRTLDCKP